MLKISKKIPGTAYMLAHYNSNMASENISHAQSKKVTSFKRAEGNVKP